MWKVALQHANENYCRVGRRLQGMVTRTKIIQELFSSKLKIKEITI